MSRKNTLLFWVGTILIAFIEAIPIAFADYDKPIAIVEPIEVPQPRSINDDCDYCEDIRKTVLSMLSASCELEPDSVDVLNNEMYQFLVGLNQRGVDELVYQTLIGAAQNNVDCTDYHKWVIDTKNRAVQYLM